MTLPPSSRTRLVRGRSSLRIPARAPAVGARRVTGPALALAFGLALAGARASAEPPKAAVPLEAAQLDMSPAQLINALAPPPPLVRQAGRNPACPPTENASSLPWIITGAAVLGMALTSVWALVESDRTRVIRSELTRIRMRRTANVRVTRPLTEHGPDVLAESHFPLTRAPARPSALGSADDDEVAEDESVDAEERAAAQQEAEEILTAAQSHLDPLLSVVGSVDDYYKRPDFDGLLAIAGPHRRTLDRLGRRVLACAAGFTRLRYARVVPKSRAEVPAEVERYWEQVYASIDDVFALIDELTTRDSRAAIDAHAGARAITEQPKRMLSASRDYLGSDGRLLVDVELTRTDVDRRLHRVVSDRKVSGVPAGKVVAVVRCGITRDGRLIRRPEVIASS